MINYNFQLILLTFILVNHCYNASKANQDFISSFEDTKEFKKFLKTHKNVLVIFSKTEKDFKNVELVNKVGESIKGKGSIVLIDCKNAKKLCKKWKANPRSVELKHFKDGEFHKVFDRLMTHKSMEKFMLDPSGDIPWEEDSSASDVIHLDKMKDLKKLLTKEKRGVLVMFYAPWCGFCKRLKPEYAAAATVLKQESVLVGVDVDTTYGESFKTLYNITAYPTIIFFKNGHEEFVFGGENNKEGIIRWMQNPHPPQVKEPEKEWAETSNDVIHLNDDNFNDVIQHGQPTLVMFYAPWCGHCKNMKPEYEKAASKIKELGLAGVLAAVDATKQKKLMKNFTISGYPTVKFFHNGEEKWEVNARTTSNIVEFMKNPQKPVVREAEVASSWEDDVVEMLTSDNFKTFIKKKKHSLVMFYTPWCGHCKRTKPEFMMAAQAFKGDNKRAFAALDCSVHGQFCEGQNVKGYPTLISYTYGKDPKDYNGARVSKDFVSFMLDSDSTLSPPKLSHWDDVENNEIITILNEKNFHSFVSSNAHVVVSFYGPSCTHCHAMREDFIETALQLQKDKVDVRFAAVDAVNQHALTKHFFISNLPTIKSFKNGVELIEFDDIARTKENFVEYVKNPLAEATSYSSYRPDEGMLDINTLDLFKSSLSTNHKLFIFFYDPSSIKCYRARSAFWDTLNQINGYKLAVVNCVQHSDICKREAVTETPSFKLFINAQFHSNFKTQPSLSTFTHFLKQNQFKVEL